MLHVYINLDKTATPLINRECIYHVRICVNFLHEQESLRTVQGGLYTRLLFALLSGKQAFIYFGHVETIVSSDAGDLNHRDEKFRDNK